MSTRKLSSTALDVADDVEAVYEHLYERGATDGLPIIPPTEERVQRMIDYVGRPPDQVIAQVPMMYGEATVEAIAVNAVMAGAKPEYMPVIIAAVEAACDERLNFFGWTSTNNSHGAAIIVNGPIRRKIDLNSGFNALGPGWRANATIGRALNFVTLNIGGNKPGVQDQASHGHPGKYTFCIAEAEEASMWEPLHVERGFKREDSTVTVLAVGTSLVNISTNNDVRSWLKANTDCLMYMGAYRIVTGKGEVVLIFPPPLTRKTTEAGMTKQDVREFIFENAHMPEDRFPPGSRLVDLPRMEPIVKDGIVRAVQKPEDIILLSTGGKPNSIGEVYECTLLEPYPASRSVTRLIQEPNEA